MASRTKPMKVIVGGMPRTGTISITTALRQLGFTPYDYTVRLESGHLPWWSKQLKRVYESKNGPVSLDTAQLDRLTANYDVSSVEA